MSQSFKRFLLQLRLDPLALLQTAGFAMFFFLTYASLAGGWLLCAAAWVFLFEALERVASRGWPAWYATPLTPNFYAVRAFGGRRTIFQRRPPNARTAGCKALLRGLLEEQRLLPCALPPGRYQAATHDAVLRRLRAMETASHIAVRPVYTVSMARIRTQLTAGRCQSCRQRCIFPAEGEPRQFYLVRFTIERRGVPCDGH